MRFTPVAALLLLSACARQDATRAADSFYRTMPNPDGCYMQVWDATQYGGASDFINGPRDYPNLRRMPNNRTWRNRIESIRVGPLANVTAFTDEDFHGSGMPLEPGTSHPLLPEDVRARIESLRVSCLDK